MARINNLYNTTDPNARVRDIAPRAPRPTWQQRTNETLGVIQNVANSPLTALALRGGQEIKHGLEDAQLRDMDAAAAEYRKLSAGRGLDTGEIPGAVAPAPAIGGAPQQQLQESEWSGTKDQRPGYIPAGMSEGKWTTEGAWIPGPGFAEMDLTLPEQANPPDRPNSDLDRQYEEAMAQLGRNKKYIAGVLKMQGRPVPGEDAATVSTTDPTVGSVRPPRMYAPSAAGLDTASMAPAAPVAPVAAPAPAPSIANATDDQLTAAAVKLQALRDALPAGDPRAKLYGERLGFVNEELTMRQRMAQVNATRPLEYEQLLEMARTANTPQAQAQVLSAIARTRFPVSSVGDVVGNAQERQAAADVRGLFPDVVKVETPEEKAVREAKVSADLSTAEKNYANAERIRRLMGDEAEVKKSQAAKNRAAAGESDSRNALRAEQGAKLKADVDQINRLVDDRENLLKAQAARTSAAVAKLRRGGGGAGKPKGPKLAEVNAGIKAETEQRQAEYSKDAKTALDVLERLQRLDDTDSKVVPPGEQPKPIDTAEATDAEIAAYQKQLAKFVEDQREYDAAQSRMEQRREALQKAQTAFDTIRDKEKTIRADVEVEFAPAKQEAKARLGVVRGTSPTAPTAPTAPVAPAQTAGGVVVDGRVIPDGQTYESAGKTYQVVGGKPKRIK